MPYARDVQSTAQTDTALVAAPGANRQIVVKTISISTDTAQVISLESGTSSLRYRVYAAANSTINIESPRGLFRCAANQSLTYTSSAAGNVFVAVDYDMVRGTGE